MHRNGCLHIFIVPISLSQQLSATAVHFSTANSLLFFMHFLCFLSPHFPRSELPTLFLAMLVLMRLCKIHFRENMKIEIII